MGMIIDIDETQLKILRALATVTTFQEPLAAVQ